jgi:hypothetical protein
MNLDDVKDAYETLSGKASDIVRQLSLAGIALIWVFRLGEGTAATIEPELRRAALFIFVALALDLTQYLVGTLTWFLFFRAKERSKTKPSADFLAPVWLNWPTWTLFWLKAAAMITAYFGYIVPFLLKRFTA